MNANLAKYYLIVTYPGSDRQVLAHNGAKAIASTEKNKELLLYIGDKLLNEHLITSYQLVCVASEEFNNLN